MQIVLAAVDGDSRNIRLLCFLVDLSRSGSEDTVNHDFSFIAGRLSFDDIGEVNCDIIDVDVVGRGIIITLESSGDRRYCNAVDFLTRDESIDCPQTI